MDGFGLIRNVIWREILDMGEIVYLEDDSDLIIFDFDFESENCVFIFKNV